MDDYDTIEYIAKTVLGVKSLKTVSMDSEDFKEHAIWNVKRALELAYKEGFNSGFNAGLDNPR